MTATPGQAAYEDVPEVYRRRLRVDQPKNWDGPSDGLVSELWREKSDEQKEFWRSLVAAQEPHAAEVDAAFAGGMRVRTGPCTVEARDREHFQVRTNGHWLCGHLLASVLAAQGIVASQEPHAPPELAQLRELLRLNRQLVVTLRRISHQQEDGGHTEAAYATGCAATMVEALWPVCNEQCTDTTHHQAQPAPELAAAMDAPAALARVLSWFEQFGTRRTAIATRAQLAHAYRDGHLDVPDELRRFL